MDEEKQVVNQGEGNLVTDTTQSQETTKPTTEQGTVEKEKPVEVSQKPEKTVPYDRFQEVNQKYRDLERKFREKELEKTEHPQITSDPYQGMTAEEKEQTRTFIDRFVLPEVQKRYEPFVREVQTEKLNKQVEEAKSFASKFGISFDEKLPEIVDYLSRPENKGRLTATEAIRNLYFDEITGVVKNKTAEEFSRERDVLMEKKRQANMPPTSTVTPSAVIQSDEMARRHMTESERRMADIQWAIEQGKQGIRNPKVKVD